MRLSKIRNRILEITEKEMLHSLAGPTEKMFTATGKKFTGTGHEVKGKVEMGDMPIGHSHPGIPIPSATDIISLHKAWGDAYDRTGTLEGLFHDIRGSREFEDYIVQLLPDPKFFNPKANIKNLADKFEAAIKKGDFKEAEDMLSRAGFKVLKLHM